MTLTQNGVSIGSPTSARVVPLAKVSSIVGDLLVLRVLGLDNRLPNHSHRLFTGRDKSLNGTIVICY